MVSVVIHVFFPWNGLEVVCRAGSLRPLSQVCPLKPPNFNRNHIFKLQTPRCWRICCWQNHAGYQVGDKKSWWGFAVAGWYGTFAKTCLHFTLMILYGLFHSASYWLLFSWSVSTQLVHFGSKNRWFQSTTNDRAPMFGPCFHPTWHWAFPNSADHPTSCLGNFSAWRKSPHVTTFSSYWTHTQKKTSKKNRSSNRLSKLPTSSHIHISIIESETRLCRKKRDQTHRIHGAGWCWMVLVYMLT